MNKASRDTLLRAVETGDPGVLRTKSTVHRTGVELGNHVTEAGAAMFRQWAVDGDTATLRTNSLSVIAKLPEQNNADLVDHGFPCSAQR
ncbi:hypothetical protein [Amycolatopsis sp. PS_44_ISF1]|uniref:hypothetical protein n=1 Tax=Amycolatopsis sp. PS_44_ISF1 TaxID=2974917 RepID=UPI0028DEFCB9|nr:hypothetical protein [Amycolatopsis sp. PS_44_ISF1]MDT8914725.1 hypothetical protein [Amycolatopsis sp. PS_44_ISF1]